MENKMINKNIENQEKSDKANKMREIEIEKIVLSIGAVEDELEKAVKLLKIISGMKAVKTRSRKRIPAFDIRPGLEIGCKVTVRKEKSMNLLKRLLDAVNDKLKEKQIEKQTLSFGIPEYIEIPGLEYQRDIGMFGLNVSVAFKRKGKRTKIKKIKKGKFPKRQEVTKKEIIKFMQENFNTEILGKN